MVKKIKDKISEYLDKQDNKYDRLLNWTEYKKRNDKVLITGLSYNMNNSPVEDLTFDQWSLNGAWETISLLDLAFDMHDWSTSEYSVQYGERLKTSKLNCPLVVPVYNENILNDQIEYPKNEVLKLAGYNFRNSIPEMIIFAHMVGFKDIYLCGIDSNEFTKYEDMGFSLYYSIGIVRGMGSRVHFMNDYTMDVQYFYGYQVMKFKDIRD